MLLHLMEQEQEQEQGALVARGIDLGWRTGHGRHDRGSEEGRESSAVVLCGQSQT